MRGRAVYTYIAYNVNAVIVCGFLLQHTAAIESEMVRCAFAAFFLHLQLKLFLVKKKKKLFSLSLVIRIVIIVKHNLCFGFFCHLFV